MSLVKPNFFIVGAPKCGTTSLASYLAEHPQIFFSRPKEPLFFCSDQDHQEAWRVTSLDDYLSLFSPAVGYRRIGEGSVWYLYSPGAARRIQNFNPNARIIIMLRNPVDLVISLHNQFLYSGNENIDDFRLAYTSQNKRAVQQSIPQHAHFPSGLLYTAVARYSDQVKRYLDIFDPQQVMVIIFEEFYANPTESFKEVLLFLDVDSNFRPGFININPKRNIKSVLVQRFLMKGGGFWRLDSWMPGGWIRNGLQWRLSLAHRRLLEWNATDGSSTNITKELRRELHKDFADDIERLGDLIGKDLSAWTNANANTR